MTKTEVIQRLQKDLGIPRFQAYIEDKDYSEEEYSQLKKDFEAYFTNYVSNVSADFEGGLDKAGRYVFPCGWLRRRVRRGSEGG